MNTVLKIFLSMSFSGGLLILALLLGKRFLKDKISRQWQYYIWLVVIVRLLLPFGPETNLMGKTYQAVGQAVTQAAPLPQQQSPEGGLPPADELEPEHKNGNRPAEDSATVHPLQEIGVLLTEQIWLVWLAVALGLLIRKATIYQSFIRYVNAGLTPVSDAAMLDRLSVAEEQAGVQKPIELCVNPLVSSPLLIGFFHPCIVLPGADLSEKDFQYIALHELTHYKRRDLFYKWLVQLTVCLHWFNPLVHLMSREITRACEFSCDEAVLARMGYGNAQDYGKTLLDAMAAIGKYREDLGAVTLSENKQLLKERLSAIMSFQKKPKAIKRLTVVLTLCVILGASFAGIYPAAAVANTADHLPAMETLDFMGKTYYLVQNEDQLRAIGTGMYGMDRNYMQKADIQLSANEWVPIGTREHPFTGTFDGNGYEITGLTMTDPYAEVVGLFGVAKNAQIHNVTVRDADIERAGRNAAITSVGAILAIGGNSYDNAVYSSDPGENGRQDKTLTETISASVQMEQYYKAGSLPLFEIAFPQLDEGTQKSWLETLYADEDFAFFSVAVRTLNADHPLLASYAEKAYADNEIAFFSVLTDCMGQAELNLWLDRALKDHRWSFQSMLFDKLNMRDEKDAQEKVWAEQQMKEYQAIGVTINGKNYYYKGQLVNILLDIRANQSFYTLNINPTGTVNIKIIRNAEDKITGVSYMTEAEATELLGDMDEPDDDWEDHQEITIPVGISSVKNGEYTWLGTYDLAKGDHVYYHISAKGGQRVSVGFAKPGQERPNPTYHTISNPRENEKLEIKSGPVVWNAASGKYNLFIHAEAGPLSDLSGYVTIIKADVD